MHPCTKQMLDRSIRRVGAMGASSSLTGGTASAALLRSIRGGATSAASAITAVSVTATVLPKGGAADEVSSSSSARGFLDSGSRQFQLFLLFLMVLQNTSVVLVGRHTRVNVAKKDLYEVSHLIMVIEVTKLFLSCILENHATNGDLMGSFKEHIIAHPLDFFSILVPALLYLVQNTLLYVALSNLSAPLFQVTYQTKLLTTALVSVLMLNRRYTPKQWFCLLALGIGVAIVVLGEKSHSSGGSKTLSESMPAQNMLIGLTAVTIACLSSAVAGVYYEKILKAPDSKLSKERQHSQPSIWMRNLQLALFSVIISAVQNFYQSRKGKVSERMNSFFHGFTPWVYLMVLIQAGGSFLIAGVMKHADNVLKGLATGVAVVLSTLLSMAIFGTPLTLQFVLGASIILVSVFTFSTDVDKRPVDINKEKVPSGRRSIGR